MKSIEELAKYWFEEFGLREFGYKPDWNYLSPDRQAAWRKEVYEVADHVLKELQAEVKPLVKIGQTNTSYAMGRQDGILFERTNFVEQLDALRKRLKEEIHGIE